MMTVSEVSKLSGVSIRTLQYYDNIGLLPASAHTASGYRLYDEATLARLQEILLFRELQFPLKDICRILHSPDYDRSTAIAQQIKLLELKRERIDALLTLARGINRTGDSTMDFSAFDTRKMDEYSAQAKAQWGQTTAYTEFEKKSKHRTTAAENALAQELLQIFAEFGVIKSTHAPDGKSVQALVKKLQAYITEHYYQCSEPILARLGQMYAAGGEFTKNIDAVGGLGTAVFVNEAITAYVQRK